MSGGLDKPAALLRREPKGNSLGMFGGPKPLFTHVAAVAGAILEM